MSQPLIFGEVLFDQFPDGNAELGGAPFNVSWHLQGFAANPMFVSAIGDDALAQILRERCLSNHFPLDWVQVVPKPTGRVTVSFTNGQPQYAILDDQAYDYVDFTTLTNTISASQVSLLYHGSLALRHHQNIETVQGLKQRIDAPTFIDINLREPWWDIAQIESLITHADIVKLNDEEFCLLTNKSLADVQWESAVPEFMKRFGNRTVVVTLGAKGVFYADDSGTGFVQSKPVSAIVDTVGAGDALAAVTIFGILQKWPMAKTLSRAVEFAASICEQRGATISDPAVYKRWLERWEVSTSA